MHHVSIQGNRDCSLYDDVDDREVFLFMTARAVEQDGWICHAYCQMTTHYHLLVQTPEPNLDRGMHRLNSAYAHWFNKRHAHTGISSNGDTARRPSPPSCTCSRSCATSCSTRSELGCAGTPASGPGAATRRPRASSKPPRFWTRAGRQSSSAEMSIQGDAGSSSLWTRGSNRCQALVADSVTSRAGGLACSTTRATSRHSCALRSPRR